MAFYRYVDDTVLIGVNWSRVKLVWQNCSSITWPRVMRIAAEFFQLVHGAPMPLKFDDYPPVLQNAPDFFAIVWVTMDESLSSSFETVAENCADPDHRVQPTGYHRSNLSMPRLATLETAVPEIALDIVPGNCLRVKTFMSMMSADEAARTSTLEKILYMLAQSSEEMHCFHGWFLQCNEDVRDLIRQGQKLMKHLQSARSSSHVQHQRLQINYVEH